MQGYTVNIGDVSLAVEALNNGSVIIYPTETVYGLGCLASNSEAMDRIAALKGSTPQAHYLLLVRSMEQLPRYCQEISPRTRSLTARFWPGPLTLILPAREGLHARLVGPSGGVAVRQSSHPWCLALLEVIDEALISTSANPTGQTAPKAICEVDSSLRERVDAVFDGGELNGLPSTILDLCAKSPLVRREGAITEKDIRNFIGSTQPVI